MKGHKNHKYVQKSERGSAGKDYCVLLSMLMLLTLDNDFSETKKCWTHGDCPRHLRCTNGYCGDRNYYEALKRRQCEDDSICEVSEHILKSYNICQWLDFDSHCYGCGGSLFLSQVSPCVVDKVVRKAQIRVALTRSH